VGTAKRYTYNNSSVPVLGPLDTDVGFLKVGQDNTSPTYNGANAQLTQVALSVLTRGEYISWPSPCGANCSYSVSFFGPAYQCVEKGQVESYPFLINLTALSQGGTNLAFSATDIEAWGASDNADNGFWIVYEAGNNTIQCTLYSATYTTNISYVDNIQSVDVDVVNRDQISSMVTTGANMSDAYQSDSEWQSLNFFTIHESIVQLLAGTVTWDDSIGRPLNIANTMIAFWYEVASINPTVISGTECDVLTVSSGLSKKMEELLINTTVSLNSLINNPPTNLTAPIIQALTNATVISYPAAYRYSPETLWPLYAGGLGLCAVCVVVGSCIIFRNGVSAEMTFSQVLVSTRGNPTLDKLSEKAYLGGDNITKELKKTKLRFGELLSFGHPGFGLEHEVVPLKRKVYSPRHVSPRSPAIPMQGRNVRMSTIPLRNTDGGARDDDMSP
jgi:hypothetical protein